MMHENVATNTESGAAIGSGEAASRFGPAAVVSLGWGFGNGFRAEVEGNWMDNQFHSASGFGGNITNVQGWEQKFGVMVNGFYDFTTLSPWIVPFVGVGVGYEAVNFQNVTAFGPLGYRYHW